jgi:transcriptional regulator with XRE-family HTH domain
MGRNRTRVSALQTGYAGARGYRGGRWPESYLCEWGIIVGDRIRRLRKRHDLTLVRLAQLVEKPEGGEYSAGYFSRLERGWAFAPLYAYVLIAEAFELDPGRLLGSDEAQKPITDAEMTLVRFTRRMGMTPDAAIALLARASPRPD